jgi:hypothetical protein
MGPSKSYVFHAFIFYFHAANRTTWGFLLKSVSKMPYIQQKDSLENKKAIV